MDSQYEPFVVRQKSYAVFADRSIIVELSSEIASAIGFGYTRLMFNHKSTPANNLAYHKNFLARTICNARKYLPCEHNSLGQLCK